MSCDSRRSLITHPDAILFSWISRQRVFQQPQAFAQLCAFRSPKIELMRVVTLLGFGGGTRGYPAQNPKCRYKIGKDSVQRVTHRMRLTINSQKYLNTEQARDDDKNPCLPSDWSVNPTPRFEPWKVHSMHFNSENSVCKPLLHVNRRYHYFALFLASDREVENDLQTRFYLLD